MDHLRRRLALIALAVALTRALADMQAQRELGVIVLAIRKAEGQMLFNPPTESKIAAGDHLIVMGESERLQELEQLLAGTVA